MVDQNKRKQLQKKYEGQQVFIVPFSALTHIEDGFTRMKHTPAVWERFDMIGRYVQRGDAEGEPSFQQIIPYVLIRHPEQQMFYVSKRIKGEERLVGQISLGFGGHIEPQDSGKGVLLKALMREVAEEVHVQPIGEVKFIGYVRGLQSPTSDHLGCVCVLESRTASIKETDTLEGLWMTPKELEEQYFSFEDWSKSIINYIVTADKIK